MRQCSPRLLQKGFLQMKMRVVDKDNGWGIGHNGEFLDFPKQDETGIAVTMWAHKVSVKPHRHHFHEFALITKGSCLHEYRGVKVSLAPGDIFFIEPGEQHGYEVSSNLELINCQFYPEMLGEECNMTLDKAKNSIGRLYQNDGLGKQWDDLVHEMFSKEEDFQNGKLNQVKLNKQGIIHLNMQERREIEYWLNKMMQEQEHQQEGIKCVKSACLQMLLVFFQRIHCKKEETKGVVKDTRKDAIYLAIEYMENHLEEKIDIEELAASVYWSSRHFRTVFKEETGMTPVEYLNRIRIIKSLEYLERNQCNIADAAASVGIYDANYYTRLFKKILGYSPKYFKSIR